MDKAIQSRIITIGDELLIGQVVDTNSAFIARQFNKIGIEVESTISIHDNEQQIMTAVRSALRSCNITILTGGLGPTKDDITKSALSHLFNAELIVDESVKDHIKELYVNRPEVINKLTETQWMVPDKAVILPNRVGSAPLMIFERGKNRLVISLPGVPHEMEIAICEQVVPFIVQWMLKRHFNAFRIKHHNVIVKGIPESTLGILLSEWEDRLPSSLHLAYLPKLEERKIILRLSAYFSNDNEEAMQKDFQNQIEKLKALVGKYFVEEEDFS